MFRELLQNAADAAAHKVTIRFETTPSSTVPVPRASDASALLKHSILNHTLKRVVVTNDGQAFAANDWSRLKRIAEGNPDETKIGAFGVGFYSVFADCEEPLVRSGNAAMAFFWKGNQLFTRMLPLSDDQGSSDTTFVLDYRNTMTSVPDLLALSQFLASSLTFVGLTRIELWLDDTRLLYLTKLTAPSVAVKIPRALETKTAEGLMRIESVARETAQIEAIWLNIVAWKPKSANATKECQPHAPATTSGTSIRSFFSKLAANNSKHAVNKIAKEEQASQEAIAEDLNGERKAVVFLHVNTATIRTKIDTHFSRELERATKKPPPKTTTIAVLTSSYDEQGVSDPTGTLSSLSNVTLANVLPSKSGRVFIGFPTHQTTGLNAHISAQSVIPTVERESIDLNARYIRNWNSELLRAAGIVCRIAWSGEIASMNDKIARIMGERKNTKMRDDEVGSLLPEAAHLCNQYTFRESTPSSQVGTLVEESFWTCIKSTSIELLSTRGILASRDVRIASDDLNFVDGIPMVPPSLQEKAPGFVRKLIDYGIITEITTADIRKELEAQALSSKQLVEFMRWLSHKARINELDSATTRLLLDVAVANDEDDSTHGKLIILSGIKHFVNASRIPADVPVPPNTIPFKFTKDFQRPDLEALGWEDLQIVPWLRWLAENSGGHGSLAKEHDLTQSAAFATRILPVISKQWDGLSQSSKATVVDLLSTRTIIPTKMGMKKPVDAYFPSVKLFDDLPVVLNLHSVKDKFLLALGVRKTVDLSLVFDRLLAPPEYQQHATKARPAWSHVDLIKYLASVRQDVPVEDINRLKITPICPAEAEISAKATNQRFRIDELFEPSEVLRPLGLRMLQWPMPFRSGSEEGRFLTYLGLRTAPAMKELIGIMVAALTDGNLALRERVLRYIIEYHYQNNYNAKECVSATTPFLPLQVEDPKAAALPSKCFTNENVTIMGFSVLRNDLHSHASKFGVQANPPILECVQRLTKNLPPTKRQAREVFEYFATRLNELKGLPLDILVDASIVPVHFSSAGPRQVRYLPPRLCFLGDGGRYAGVLDYVDFGTTANTFLLRCGSKYEPTTVELAQLIVREPARVFTTFDSTDRYLDLLRSLADSWPKLKKDSSLVKDMRRVPFLLAYREMPSGKDELTGPNKLGLGLDTYVEEDDLRVRTYELANASDIIIVDDVIEYNLFKSAILAAPMEEELEDFYKALGSTGLSSIVEQFARIGSVLEDQSVAVKLQKLILERVKLFLHDVPRDAVQHNTAWMEKNFSIVGVRSLSVRKALRGRNISHNIETTATFRKTGTSSYTLYVTTKSYDIFDVSSAVLRLLLSRPKPQQTIVLMTLLETNLYKLRSRGYNVERILRQKAAEARIADEQRQRQLAQEQQRIEDQQSAELDTRPRHPGGSEDRISMPGVFPETPERKSDQNLPQHGLDEHETKDQKQGGFFANLTRNFGGGFDKRPQERLGVQTSAAPPPPPPAYSPDGTDNAVTPLEPIDDPNRLQEALRSAIQASRPHNSHSVVSQPNIDYVNDVRSFCDPKPAQNISLIAQTDSGTKIFLSNSMPDKNVFMSQHQNSLNQFASVLQMSATPFSLSKNNIHIFHEHSSTIAFNSNKALFFNFRFFEKLHLNSVGLNSYNDAVVYWFVVMCHELAHNIVSDHSAAHSYYTYVSPHEHRFQD